MEKYDFSGWATRANLKCSDGRVILPDAFKHNDGRVVPLVWNHRHDEPINVLGHALLENRIEGVYTYCTFNDTEQGRNAKLLVEHGDIVSLSIYANQLKQQGSNVAHGEIREVSLVLAGANPGAFIDSVIKHGEESEEEAVIYTDESIALYHAKEEEKEETKKDSDKEEEKVENDSDKESKEAEKDSDKEEDKKDASEEKGKTLAEVYNSMNEEQQELFQKFFS